MKITNFPHSPDEELSARIPAPLTKTLEVRVIQQAKNPRFVYADLEGNRIAVAVPPKIAARLTGKIINVIASDGAEETTYTYQP